MQHDRLISVGERNRWQDIATAGEGLLVLHGGVSQATKRMDSRKSSQPALLPSVVAVKTKLCHRFAAGACSNLRCTFAHGESDLRRRPDLRKTKLCSIYLSHKTCPHGADCTSVNLSTKYRTQACTQGCLHKHTYESTRASLHSNT